MSPPPIRAHIPQPDYILPQLPPQVVFNLHTRELGVDVDDGLRVERAQTRRRVDVQAREQVPGYLASDAVEGLERSLGWGLGGWI